ncbi:hypothetical protein T265_09741 [Opisthorchis viverrini]|uniref:Uncharacterized protein n=1 Tax=Opisthorchis viverrini TaxID=6198 RepID=A0A075A3X7_OPIVI|nr:hypothetical protein T265_09741 [Opisthorchis viverrini]KER22089.1 hypothetical protein T265_09741 [Opisthorchis viverrini]
MLADEPIELPPAMRSHLPPPPQIISERNCGSYNHCTTSTWFLQPTMMMMINVICWNPDRLVPISSRFIPDSVIVMMTSIAWFHSDVRYYTKT